MMLQAFISSVTGFMQVTPTYWFSEIEKTLFFILEMCILYLPRLVIIKIIII